MRRYDELLGSLMDLGELANSDQVVGSGVQDAQELGSRLVETPELEERPAKRDPRRQIRRMLGETCLTHPDGLLAVTGPPVLLGKLRKSNRRRILENPASKVFNPGVVSHPYSLSHSHRSRNG